MLKPYFSKEISVLKLTVGKKLAEIYFNIPFIYRHFSNKKEGKNHTLMLSSVALNLYLASPGLICSTSF